MLDVQTVVSAIQAYGAVDFDCELDDGVMWFRGINCYLIIAKVTDKQVFLTVWEDDECNEIIENFEIQSLDELKVCLDKYALIAHDKTQASVEQNKPSTDPTDTTMIDIYVKLIKEKLAENNISLNFEECNQAERLIIRHIEGELAKIVEFLR